MFAVTYYLVFGVNVRAHHAFCPAQVHYYCYLLLLLYAFLEQINYNNDDYTGLIGKAFWDCWSKIFMGWIITDAHAMWASEPGPKWALGLKE